MSSITNVNNNASVINVGRTTPVSPGVQPASKSIPVVMASDQTAIPVEEQNKVQSEVALSLLGIPRAEVALGIFADVNTYDVNPSEWSSSPEYHVAGYGIKHLPNEAGALVEAPRNKSAVLTSKRFFRYQPGRVSAATFGIKSTVSQKAYAQNPAIRKFGIYDNFDGYFWETRNDGQEDNFSVVRRSQSMIKSPNSPFGNVGLPFRGAAPAGQLVQVAQNDDYRIIGLGANESVTEADNFAKDRELITNSRYAIIDSAVGVGATAKVKRDLDYLIDFYLLDMQYNGDGHTRVATTNYSTEAALPDIQVTDIVSQRSTYAALRTALLAVPGLSSTGLTKITQLTAIFTEAFNGTTVAPQLTNANYGSKNKFETIFDAKTYYWAYIVSTKTEAGAAITYTVTGSGLSSGLTADDIKYKCQRDVGYIIDGYKYDVIGGGNAHTKYNMSMYFRGEGMSIYSQLISALPSEIERHTHLRNLILSTSQLDLFYAGSTLSQELAQLKTAITKLSTKVINNFSIENTDSMETGTQPFYGNLVALRDGLILTHAAVYDPSLLKDQTPVVSVVNTDNTFVLTDGHVTFGQRVRVSWSNAATVSTCGTLVAGTVYKVARVFGPKGNVFTLVAEPTTASSGSDATKLSQVAGTAQTFTVAQATAAGTIYVTTVVPFIFPSNYNPAFYRVQLSTNINGTEDGKLPSGMVFPYMYAGDQNLLSTDTAANTASKRVGFINTALDLSSNANLNIARTQIDEVNFNPEYINWIKNNVKPEYYGVYDYRVPRSRFSHDALNGKSENAVDADLRVYSDRATGETGTVRPGQKYTVDAVDQSVSSLYNYDFTKVTMLKIEFSWYGAVGALFLAYVPVENGEARWVRVHHLRASNQLKIASLGNATLPITYTTYGGGDSKSLGDGEDVSPIDQGYNSTSHSVVKYGASYYIDGGDRGTVRLCSHNNEDTIDSYGKRWAVSGSIVSQTLDGVATTPALAINGSTLTGPTDNSTSVVTVVNVGGVNTEPKFFIGARLKTNNRVDQSIEVIWANSTHVFLSGTPIGTSGFTLLSDRANTVFGLETKRVILSTREGNAVRNRVQVYPTKLSASNLGDNPVRLRLKKTPLFQTNVAPSGTLRLSADYTVNANNAPLAVIQSGTYLANGESTYGWFRATVGVDKVSIFGELYKLADAYYFELLESFSGTVILGSIENFLADGRFEADGTEVTATSSTRSTTDKGGLSSITIVSNTVVPIPNTGINVATIYLQQGTEQLDLSPYFDYNKEYLSFPLTNQADSLYFAVDSDRPVESALDEVSLGVTWEEQ